ncbi:MAG: hypothetical protein ACK5MK_05500 [Dysgonomonas sp.]
MSKGNDPISYDEDEAVKFIKKTLTPDLQKKMSDDEINYIIDIIYDFYEDKGLMDTEGSNEEIIDIDEDELIEYVLKNTIKDKITKLSAEEITLIIKGELEYCDSLDMFEE